MLISHMFKVLRRGEDSLFDAIKQIVNFLFAPGKPLPPSSLEHSPMELLSILELLSEQQQLIVLVSIYNIYIINIIKTHFTYKSEED